MRTFNWMGSFVLVAASLLSNSASATQGQILQCVSTDLKASARVSLGSTQPTGVVYPPSATVYKLAPTLPQYTFPCYAPTGADQLLFCTDTSNRTFIVYTNYTAKYIGSHESRAFTCNPAGTSAD